MFGDFFTRLFEDSEHAESILMLAVLVVVGVGIWFGRKRLALSIPIAVGILLFAAVTIPSCIPAHTKANRALCINNLKMIESAKEAWALENKKADEPIETDLAKYMKNGVIPKCPT